MGVLILHVLGKIFQIKEKVMTLKIILKGYEVVICYLTEKICKSTVPKTPASTYQTNSSNKKATLTASAIKKILLCRTYP